MAEIDLRQPADDQRDHRAQHDDRDDLAGELVHGWTALYAKMVACVVAITPGQRAVDSRGLRNMSPVHRSRSLATAIVTSLLGACAHPHDVVSAFPHHQPDSGALDVVLNDPSRKLTVTVNDQLVVDRAFTRRAHIDGVPSGVAYVHVASGGKCEQGRNFDRKVTIEPGQLATLAVPGPEPNLGCMVWSGLDEVAAEVGVVAVAVVLLASAPLRVVRLK